MRRLKQLEDENSKLRKVVADLSLDKGRPPTKALKPVRKRKLVAEMRGDWDVSIRRASRVFLVDTSTYHYKSRRPGQAALEQRIKEICQTRVPAVQCGVTILNSNIDFRKLRIIARQIELPAGTVRVGRPVS